jgi:hypothetical protein
VSYYNQISSAPLSNVMTASSSVRVKGFEWRDGLGFAQKCKDKCGRLELCNIVYNIGVASCCLAAEIYLGAQRPDRLVTCKQVGSLPSIRSSNIFTMLHQAFSLFIDLFGANKRLSGHFGVPLCDALRADLHRGGERFRLLHRADSGGRLRSSLQPCKGEPQNSKPPSPTALGSDSGGRLLAVLQM